jgi:GH15 family glucan-1,4-alpha-glucosidase
MDAIYLYDKNGEPISYALWLNLSRQINWLVDHWHDKDEGIWEVRGGKKEFLYSRLMCWVAFDRAIKIGIHRSYPFPQQWIEERNKIFTTIHEEFYNKDMQSFVQYKGAETVDAATLLMPIVGFISSKDPKWVSTLKMIEDRLVTDFLVYRYRNNQNLDGLTGGEGTFSMCTFWYVECLSMAGQLDKARLYFEKMLGYANHVGLFAEQLGFNGQHLGNYPQAFTHLGLISAALNLDHQLNNDKLT